MLPFQSIFNLDRNSPYPLYQQLTNQFIELIRTGMLATGSKLPGSRSLASLLGVHRKTIIATYDELEAQGWILVQQAKGTFVNQDLPITTIRQFQEGNNISNLSNSVYAGFTFKRNSDLYRKDSLLKSVDEITISDGVPDVRLTPIELILATYRRLSKKTHHLNNLEYGSLFGQLELRETLGQYLKDTRGLNVSVNQILITRGSQMAIYLFSQLLKNQGPVVVGETNYISATQTFELAEFLLTTVQVDHEGLVIQDIERICQSTEVSAIYLTSHHHHPTTVSLSAQRRLSLLNLSRLYQIPILEDDYAYDLHYDNAPILPLASYDNAGLIVYAGSFCKLIAPGIRIGFMVGPEDFIHEAAQLRRFIDRQGDPLLELSIAKLIQDGSLQRHTSKIKKIYKERRDLFCTLLSERLNDYFEFEIPKGGMAIWVILKKGNWEDLTIKAKIKGLNLPDWKKYDYFNLKHNGVRFGFASLNCEEIRKVVDRLCDILN